MKKIQKKFKKKYIILIHLFLILSLAQSSSFPAWKLSMFIVPGVIFFEGRIFFQNIFLNMIILASLAAPLNLVAVQPVEFEFGVLYVDFE